MKMRHFLFFILSIVIVACNNKPKPVIDYTGFVDRQVVLDSGLGTVSFKLLARFDTFYKWIDHVPNEVLKWNYYRFADRKYAIVKDCSGDCYNEYDKDSIYQFSVRHIYFPDYYPDSILKQHRNWKVSRLLLPIEHDLDGEVKAYLFDSLEINNRNFKVAYFNKNDLLVPGKSKNRFVLRAQTFLKKNIYLEFRAEYIALDTIGFKDNIYKTIQSILIKE